MKIIDNISALVKKVIGTKGKLNIPAYWMRRILLMLIDSIPVKISQLSNDSNYVKESDLVNTMVRLQQNTVIYTTIGNDNIDIIEDDNILSATYENGLGIITYKNETSFGHNVSYNNVETIILGNNITGIDPDTFYNCRNLKKITLGNGVTTIGERAFSGCEKLTNIIIPDKVTKIGHGAFGDCNLDHIIIPSSVVDFGNNVFSYNDQLKYVIHNLKEIKSGTFQNCKKLSEFYFFGCNIIGDRAFRLSGLRDIDLNPTSIGIAAFDSCKELTNVDIGSNITSIGQNAFYGCYNLYIVYVRATTPPTLGANAFGLNHDNRIICVPKNSLDAYKNAPNWSDYADSIKTI